MTRDEALAPLRVDDGALVLHRLGVVRTTYIIVGQRGWAKGDTWEEAVANAKRYAYVTIPTLHAQPRLFWDLTVRR